MGPLNAKYLASYPNVSICPKQMKAEYAFIGRSNVGKSSLINMLTGKPKLAHVSGKPGKTQMINYFDIEDKWNLVDLPGFGYAKLSKKQRATWSIMIKDYVCQRQQLVNTFILIDSGVPPQTIDLEFIELLGKNGIPFSIVFTKIDRKKLQRNDSYQIDAFKARLLEDWTQLPPCFETSSMTGEGREAILDYIEEITKVYYNSL